MAAIERANEDIERGDYGMARVRLASYLSSKGYDSELLKRLGEISFEMHDLAQAGRYWLASSAEGEQVEEAVASFVRYSGGDSRAAVCQLPRVVREAPMSVLPERARERLRRLGLEDILSSWNPAEAQRSAGDVGWRVKALVLLSLVGFVGLLGVALVGGWTIMHWLMW